MSRRAFGPAAEVISARELGGGTFNRTFLITLAHQPAILRIAPPLTAEVAWHEQQLMRREHLMQPFFAAVAYRMPRTLFTDFTGQVIERDYMFQAFLEGERWDDVADHLSPSESAILWEEFGRLTRSIHDTRGTSFGGPPPLPEFRTWSEASCTGWSVPCKLYLRLNGRRLISKLSSK